MATALSPSSCCQAKPSEHPRVECRLDLAPKTGAIRIEPADPLLRLGDLLAQLLHQLGASRSEFAIDALHLERVDNRRGRVRA